ncbi:Acyltransferase family protein [Bradyrhizobium lablabi]|uniref:Acyltransferase family protein n=1 Tax=Bradyrhizobium lablabi TaxID=722472 RepID=A0A1M7DRF5_9BRAD|nr:acyltransferase [Bradyrhizobium lablabi]SHL81749.1 Acyltransferase family protein [Bradyrhizobium lablabi]
MLRKPDSGPQTVLTVERIVPLDRARSFITLLVVLHHSVINYTYFGNADRMRWLGFDLIVLFNDSFFMACMFFISGLFVHDSLARRRPANFLANRAWRLGVPFLISIFVVMPIAYYPTFLRHNPQAAIDSNFLHFWWNTLTIGPWPSGSAWFLWVLLALDAIAALLWAAAPRLIETFGQLIATLHERPMTAFAAFLTLTVIIYLPMRVMFGDTSWLVPGHYPLPIQTSRILLYAGYFLTGVGVGAVNLKTGVLAENGALAKRWVVWLAFAFVFYGVILLLVYAHHNWLEDFNSPPLWWHTAYGLAFAMFSAAMTFTIPAVFLRFARSPLGLLDAMRPSAYGIYLVHFVFLIWLQYIVYDPPFPAFVKFAIVFTGTLSMSWALTLLLRRIPAVARTI